MDWYIQTLRKYAVFTGRARRKEFWIFFLISTLFSFALILIGKTLGWGVINGVSIIELIFEAAIVVPFTALIVRRLHDINHSGLWIFTVFVPFVGPFILLLYFINDSQPGTNRFGPNPKET